mgnify:CR=1 FL=1
MNTCDACKHYTPTDSVPPHVQDKYQHAGTCELIQDESWTPGGMAVAIDRVSTWDAEGYSSGAYVGRRRDEATC